MDDRTEPHEVVIATQSENVSVPHKRMRNSRPHDARKLRISLKQWRILHAVIDCGGFADAAKFMHLSQSAISYTVAKMQEQLGVPILKLVGRKAHVTDAGRELLEQSRYLLKEALALESIADNIRQGGTSEVRLVVEQNFPAPLLMLALRPFTRSDAGTRVCLSEVSMHHAVKALSDRSADLAIMGHLPPDFLGQALTDIEYVAVAHPDHSLFRLGHSIGSSDLKHHVRIVTANALHPMHAHMQSPGGVRHWSVNSSDTAIDALCECLGYAWLPRHRILGKLNKGQLKLLPLTDGGSFRMTFYLVHGHCRGSASGASQLADALHAAVAVDTTISRA